MPPVQEAYRYPLSPLRGMVVHGCIPCRVSMAIRRYPIILQAERVIVRVKTRLRTQHISTQDISAQNSVRDMTLHSRELEVLSSMASAQRCEKKKRLASRKRGSYVLFRPLSLPPIIFLGGRVRSDDKTCGFTTNLFRRLHKIKQLRILKKKSEKRKERNLKISDRCTDNKCEFLDIALK